MHWHFGQATAIKVPESRNFQSRIETSLQIRSSFTLTESLARNERAMQPFAVLYACDGP
jgi:hypothetical protein